MRQAPRKRSELVAHFIGGTIAHSFVFCNRGLAGFFLGGWSCCGLRPPSAEGLLWPTPLSHLPTLQRFWKQGDSPCTPGGAAPLHPAGGMDGELMARTPLSRPLCPGTFSRTGGLAAPPAGAAPPAPCLGNGGFVVACALHQRRVWLGLRRCPTGPPSNVFGNRGTRCTPGGGCAPAPCLGNGGGGVFSPGASGCFLARLGGVPGRLGEGDGTVAKRDPARSQRGHSAVIARS